MTTIAVALQAVRERIAKAARAANRPEKDITLLAISKGKPVEAIREAYRNGQRAFGESYLQEALPKLAALHDLPIEWHFVGPIQSNKTRDIAGHFSWVHGVDRGKIAQRLSGLRAGDLRALQICLQVNVSGETSKHGVGASSLRALADSVRKLPGLQLRGLMAIPAAAGDDALQHRQYKTMRSLMDELNRDGFGLDTLSMGMSRDIEAAIAEGATMLRVGSAIFGERTRTGQARQ
ncbi:MAG: YggS family pyridoxal phosphate-dependent enzyme [Burkholderiales bacterium]